MPFIDNGTPVKTTNGFELANRLRKVSDMTAFIWAGLTPVMRRDDQLPWKTSEQGAEWWAALSVRTGHNERVSEETRTLVVVALCKLVNAERKGATERCGGCDSDGMENVHGGGNGDPEWDAERTHEECRGTAKVLCEDCREHPATVVVPTGFFDLACAEKTWPEIAKHARMILEASAPAEAGAAQRRERRVG